MKVLEVSIRHKVTIVTITLVIILLGLASLCTLGFDLMPEIERPVLTIVTEYSGVAAEDIEELVTKPIEQVVSAVKGIKNVNSTSSEGYSTVIAEFKWGSDLDTKSQDVRNMLERIKKFFPEDVGSPLVFKINMSQMPVLLYGVSGMKNTNELRKHLKDDVVPRIERINGVAHAVIIGGLSREIGVFLNRNKVEHYKIKSLQITGALSYGNMNISGGYINSGNNEYLVRTVGFFQDISDIENTVVAASNGALVRIRDIGRVEDTYEEGRNNLRVNGKDAVIFAVSKQSGVNTVAMVKKVKKTLEELAPNLPAGIEFNPIFDQGRIIKHSTNSMITNIIIGTFLVVLLILLFLRDWRPTVAIAIAIPLSIITTFIGMKLFGYTFNAMTLSGLALVVGHLVYGAVVVIDNTLRHLHKGKDRETAAKKGVSEVFRAIGTSTLVTIAVFLPMAMGGGMAGQLMKPQVITICFALLASLIVAVTVVPMIAASLFKHTRLDVYGNDRSTFNSLRNKYKKALQWSLAHRETVLALTVSAFIISIFMIPLLGAEFMPSSDYGMVILKIKTKPGTNLAETNRIVAVIEERISAYPESRLVLVSVGPPSSTLSSAGSGSFFAKDVNEATIMVRLQDRKDRRRSCDQIVAGLRKSFPVLRDVNFEFIDASGNSNGTSPIEIKLFGKDLDVLKQKADEGVALIRDIPGLTDITVSMQDGKPAFIIVPDRDRASLLGLTAGEIGNAVRLSNFGQVVTRYRDSGDEVNVRVQLDKNNRTGTDDMRLFPIVSRFEGVTPVANIADIQYDERPVTITREKRTRKVTITGNVQGQAINSIGAKIKAKFNELHLPSGYFVEYGGTYKNMFETSWYLFIGIIIAIFLVYMILTGLFESFTQSFAIMVAVPLGWIGCVLGLSIFGLTFSSPAFMGFMIIVGIVVTNGIVIVDYVNQLRKRGSEMHEAIIRGALVKFRPIVINALATAMGSIPMMLANSDGAEMMRPLAVTVGCGFLVSAFLTLFIVPIVYSMVGRASYGALNVLSSESGTRDKNNAG